MALPMYREAIARIESGGRYDIVGPRHPKMGRALGKYQVMEANVGPWTRAALGRELTPEEFLSNPQAQDAVFDHVFGGYVQQYGPEGAAQAWFGGPGGVGKTGRKDSLGTSIGKYGQMFMSGIGDAKYAGLPDGPKGQESYPLPQPATGGGLLASAPEPFSIPTDVAQYATSDDKGPLGKLGGLLSAIGEAIPDAPTGHLGGGGDARQSGGLLNEFLNSPPLWQAMKKRRFG